jgi:hypothetical protein
MRRYNSQGYENADLCAWTFSTNTFSAGGGLANVRWNCNAKTKGCTSRYYLIQVRGSLSVGAQHVSCMQQGGMNQIRHATHLDGSS